AQDSAGAGRWRGGLGVETEFVIDAANVTGIAFGDGIEEEARAFGLFGGKPGSLNEITITYPDDSIRRPRAKEVVRGIPRGSVYRQHAGGGGGYGAPLERPLQQVIDDVLDGLLSVEAAREDYGVVFDPATLTLDEAKTAVRRGR
ncbi:MAG: hydantoinase B/oxoprolinase family protein, partial [Nitrospira sp.]|nr:hydantoinase B/oxoprolinase family protein [Nitrospira sp.]